MDGISKTDLCQSCSGTGEIVVNDYAYRCLMCRPEAKTVAHVTSSQAKVSTSPRGAYFKMRLEKAREDFEPAQRGCGQCHCCKTKNRFGCSRNADQSMIQAVTVMAE